MSVNMRFTKLVVNLAESSVWREPLHVRVVWTILLSKCDMDGIARIAPNCVHAVANVTEEQAADAIERLSAPDPHSRTPDFEGRRIEWADGGYRILNYFRYRATRSPSQRAEYMREYMKEYRANGNKGTRKVNINTKRGSVYASEWRDDYRIEAAAASGVPVPADFPDCVRDALIQFSQRRMELATKGRTKAESAKWTIEMRKSLHDQIRLQLSIQEPQAIADKLLASASSTARRVNFTRILQ